MCNINGYSRKRIGYKVLAVKDGKFYSTFTGQEIKVGAVPLPPEYCKRLSDYWNIYLNDDPLRAKSFYNPEFVGYTSVFTDKDNANKLFSKFKRFTSSFKPVVVKIEFKGLTAAGTYDFNDDDVNIIAGKYIKSITVINPKSI